MTRRFLAAASHVAMALALAAPALADTPVNVVYQFSATTGPPTVESGLTLVGSSLYGTTFTAGSNGGTLYSLPIGGTSINLMHTFSGSDGVQPAGVATIGSTLYGVTYQGGQNPNSSGPGVVYSIGADGSNFTVVNEFSTSGSAGGFPGAPLTAVGTNLYGTTVLGSTHASGAVFAVATSPTSVTSVVPFPSNAINGLGEASQLVGASGVLYGLISNGTSSGSAFSVHTDGSDYTVLHSFGPTLQDLAGMTLIGSTLYGAYPVGGTHNDGEIFSMNLDGSNFTVLHSFSGSDGLGPSGGLTRVGSTLYGTTDAGGTSSDGTIFSVNLDGTGFTTVHSFLGTDGSAPRSGFLALDGSTLYGVTVSGGTNGDGVIFSIPTPEPGSMALLVAGVPVVALVGRRAIRRRKPHCRS